MFVYLLEVNVYEDEYEKDWVTGRTAVYQTAEGALEAFKAWCRQNFIDPAEATLGMVTGAFTGCDVEVSMDGFDADVYMSWGINQMEVQG